MHESNSFLAAAATSVRPFAFVIACLLIVLTPPAGAQVPGQDGLLGEYYDDIGLQTFVESRIDPGVDFTTWTGAPTGTAVTPDESYSERWSGAVRVDQAGDWTFRTISNDGVRLTIDGVAVITDWSTHPVQSDSVVVPLLAGWHPLTLEHFQSGGGVAIQLFFEGPGQPEVIIPADHLTPSPVSNLFPTFDLGLDKTLVPPDSAILLDSGAEDPDGTVVQIQWVQLSGPPVTWVDATQPMLDVTGLVAPGDHVFQVTAWDDAGFSVSDTVTVTVADCFAPEPVPLWQRWSTIIEGPMTFENANPNPFLDYRLDVLFTHGATGQTWLVPGFYDADGRPYDSSASEGDNWRVNFSPGLTGGWVYEVSFRQGPGIALSQDPTEGTPLEADGLTGCFRVGPPDANATGFHATGRLVTAGGHHLRSAGTGKPFLQAGANSPENLLAYFAFDQTTAKHLYVDHIADWNTGDPKWKGLGKGLIGALNYLAGEGMTTVWFLTYTVGGDGDDVWPWTSITERLRFDCSKLGQWELVFDHMDALGLQLHIVTQEQENDNGTPGLDGGALGVERALYYRELVARFAHHLGVVWNLGEENSNSHTEREQFHDFIRALDPYDHPIVVHTFPLQQNFVYKPMLKSGRLDGTSLAVHTPGDVHAATLQWRLESAVEGRPWVVGADEIGPAAVGVLPDDLEPAHDDSRKQALWGNLMAGGAGVQWYFGMAYPHHDLNSEDWRQRETMWRQTRHAIDFFHAHLPFDEMDPDDELVDAIDAWCLAQPGEVYAVYLPAGGSTQLDLGQAGAKFTVHWYDPRNGGPLVGASMVQGPGDVLLTAPTTASRGDDWVAVVKRAVPPPGPPPVHVLGGGSSSKARTNVQT